MQRSHRSTGLVLAGAATLAFGLASCGVTGGDGTGVQALAVPQAGAARMVSEAAEQTGDARTQRVAVELVVTGGDGEVLLTTTGDGAFDEEAEVGRMTTSVSAGMGVDLDTEVIFDGEDAYVRAGVLESLTGGKPWVKVSEDDLGDVADELGVAASDPGSFVELLEGAAGPLEDRGTETVRGVPTRHLAGSLDVARLVDEVAPDEADDVRDLLEELPAVADDLSAIPVEVWVDGEGYVRRFTLTLRAGGDGDGPGAGAVLTQTVELWDFDEPLTITPPPADEVGDLDASGLLGD